MDRKKINKSIFIIIVILGLIINSCDNSKWIFKRFSSNRKIIQESNKDFLEVYLCMRMEFEELEIDKSLQLRNGKVLRNLNDLKQYVNDMPDEVYNYHISDGKNDFAFWLKNCLGMNQLANGIAGIKKKENFIKKILES